MGVARQHAHLINEVPVLCCEVAEGLDKTHGLLIDSNSCSSVS